MSIILKSNPQNSHSSQNFNWVVISTKFLLSILFTYLYIYIHIYTYILLLFLLLLLLLLLLLYYMIYIIWQICNLHYVLNYYCLFSLNLLFWCHWRLLRPFIINYSFIIKMKTKVKRGMRWLFDYLVNFFHLFSFACWRIKFLLSIFFF